MLYAYLKKALTIPAIVLAGLFTFVITYYSGYAFFLMILAIFMVDKIFAHITKKKSDKKRNIYQIAANLLMAFISIICYILFKDSKYLLIASCVLAGSLSDTLSSTIGVVSNKCFDCITFKKGTPGLSGNISLLGIGGGLLGALIIACIYYYLVDLNYHSYLLITLIGLLGSLVDSIIGSLFQVKYQCKNCGVLTESRKHCGVVSKKIKGFKNIDNNIVNFLESLIIFIIGLLFF